MTRHDFSENDVVLPTVELVTDEPGRILRYAHESFLAGVPVALVTLVEVRGGAARAVGAQMAVRGDGRYCGFVSGGCTETAVAAEAIEALRKGRDRFLRLGEGSPFFDIVLPCGEGSTYRFTSSKMQIRWARFCHVWLPDAPLVFGIRLDRNQ